MSQQDVEIVLDQFAATNERAFERAMTYYADDVELVVQPDAYLEAGTFSGREAVGEYFGNWFRTFEPGYRFDITEARDLGGRRPAGGQPRWARPLQRRRGPQGNRVPVQAP